MVELLLVVGSALGLSLFAAEGAEAVRARAGEREAEREKERGVRLLAVRTRMAMLEYDAGAGGVHPKLADEYDRLVLEERILEADEI